MTRTKLVLTRRWRWFAIIAALLILGGAVLVVWLRVDKANSRAAELAAEANRRGDAVSTLATDVRTLRAQIQADGETPAAPDPAKAVKGLPARAEVPVPVPGPPGPPGEKGERGKPGKPAPTITPSPGQSGEPGEPGADSTVPGPSGQPGRPGVDGQDGADGEDGQDGADGRDGRDGQPPVAWTWSWNGTDYACRRADPFDPQAPRYECESTGEQPEPEPEPSPADDGGILGLVALDPRRSYPRGA